MNGIKGPFDNFIPVIPMEDEPVHKGRWHRRQVKPQ